MTVQIGMLSYAGIGAESSYGTAVTRSRFMPFRSESLKPTDERIMSGDLYRVDFHSGQRAQGRVTVGGGITFVPRYHSTAFQMLLQHLMGSVATTQPDITNAASVYRHTFTPANTLPTGLSIEIVKDTKAFLHTGMKVTSGRFAFSQGEVLESTFDFTGRQTADSSPGTAFTGFLDGNMVTCTAATLTWEGVAQSVTGGEVTITNPLGYRHTIDSRLTAEPFRNGHRTVSGSFETYFEDVTLYANFRNAQNRALVVTFTGNVISGAFSYDLQFSIPIAQADDAFPASTAEGAHMHTIPFTSLIDDNNSVCSIRLTNTNTTA